MFWIQRLLVVTGVSLPSWVTIRMELISIMYGTTWEMLLKNNCNDWSSICSFVGMEQFVLVVSTAKILNFTIGQSIKRVESKQVLQKVGIFKEEGGGGGEKLNDYPQKRLLTEMMTHFCWCKSTINKITIQKILCRESIMSFRLQLCLHECSLQLHL